MYRKEVHYNHETENFDCYLDGELVGYANTYEAGLVLLNLYVNSLVGGVYWRSDSDY